MAHGFRVAILGPDHYWHPAFSLEVFNLNADQICDLLEKPDINRVTELGALVTLQYYIMMASRTAPPPSVSREEVAEVMQGVDIVIIFMTSPYFSFYYKEFFFDYMFKDNLAKHCHILIRIQHITHPTLDQYNPNTPSSDPDDIMSRHGLERNKIKAKITIIADEVKTSKRPRRGKMEGDPVKRKVAELHYQLKKKEVKQQLTQPIEETISAGKSLLGLGQRFGSWIGSLIMSVSSSPLENRILTDQHP